MSETEAPVVRGLFTAASGMNVQQNRLDEIANNLANVDLNGYKKDTAIQKAFPEMLMRRMNDDGVYRFPFGSVDTAPIVGTLGTGVETNEVYTNFTQGPLKQTENDFDLALEGSGFMTVQTPQGERLTRNGAFLVNSDGYLVTKTGDFVLGENGPIKLKKNNFVIDQDGTVWQNSTFAADDKRLVSQAENQWENIEKVDRLKIVDVKRETLPAEAGQLLLAHDRRVRRRADHRTRRAAEGAPGLPGRGERERGPGDGGDDRSEPGLRREPEDDPDRGLADRKAVE